MRVRRPLTSIYWTTLSLVILLGAGGCLPSSCGHAESRAITAADSTSRAIAATTPVDTLTLLWSTTGAGTEPFEYPRTLLFDDEGTLWISDASTGLIQRFDSTGKHLQTIGSELFSYPFLAGAAGDSIFVFSPGRQRLQRVFDASVSDFLNTPSPPKKGLLQYAHVGSDGTAFAKLLGEEFTGFVRSLPRTGADSWQTELPGPVWRRAGGLKSWGDTLISLRGYQPVVDLLLDGGTLDSMRLVGFDSPMLARSRLFGRGQIDVPPLLLASAAGAGDRLFVLNMRPGWLRVDVYGQTGRLESILTQPNPSFNQNFYPTDIAAFRKSPVTTYIAISVVEPRPRVDYYEWRQQDVLGP